MHLKIVRGFYLIVMLMAVVVLCARTQTQGGAGSGEKPDEEQSFQGYVVKTYSGLDDGLGRFEVYKNGKLIYQKAGYHFYIGLADQVTMRVTNWSLWGVT